MKKIILTAVIALAAFAAFAQPAAPKGPDFKNRTSSGIVNMDVTNNVNSFAGIENNTAIELLSGKVDCGIDATFVFNSFHVTGDDGTYFLFKNLEINDWYIEFRPFDNFTFGIHDVIYTHGSYLPVLNKNIDNGNIGSDIVVVWRPVVGARIAFGYDIPTWFGKDEAGNEAHPVFNFGADYTYGKLFSIGVTARDVINDFSFGLYSEMLAVQNLYVTFGYSYNDKIYDENNILGHSNYYGISGKNLIALGAKYDYKNVGFGFDFLTNCGAENAHDFYIGSNISLGLTKNVALGFKFQTALEADDTDISNVYEFVPSFTYTEKTWNCGVAVDVLMTDKTVVSFPVYFEFSL